MTLTTTEKTAQILRNLEGLRRNHDTCDDSYYSCPKSGDCSNESLSADYCNCGADEYNGLLDSIVATIRGDVV